MHRARRGAFAGLHQPRRAVAVRAPEAAPLPPGVRIVDPAVEPLSVEAYGIGDADRDELAVLERHESIVQVCRRDWDVLAEPDRVVLVDPGVIARFGAVLAQALEARTRV